MQARLRARRSPARSPRCRPILARFDPASPSVYPCRPSGPERRRPGRTRKRHPPTRAPMDPTQLDTELLPYPLPPWKHRFRTLSIFCEVDEAALQPTRAGAAGARVQRRADHRHALREHGADAALLRQRRHRPGALRRRGRRALGACLHQHRPGVRGHARALGLPHEARLHGASRRHEPDLGLHRAPRPARDRHRHAADGPGVRAAQDLPAPLREGAAGGGPARTR